MIGTELTATGLAVICFCCAGICLFLEARRQRRDR